MNKVPIFMVLAFGCIALFATTYAQVEKICSVCGEKSTQTVVMTTNSSGSSDLDARPPEMQRSTIASWVQKCPACGYCAADIATLLKNAKDTVSSPAYKAQLSNADFPELANKFLCRMLIQDKAGESKAAIYSAICAGWASDDANMPSAATAARELGIKRLLDFNGNNEQYRTQKGADELLIADMLRRNAQFEKAKQSAGKGLALAQEEIIKTILNFEIELAEKKDIAVHRVAEAVKK
jgi:hypothetical protein